MLEEFSTSVSHFFEELGYRQKVELLKPPSAELGDFSIILNKLIGKDDPNEFMKNHLDELTQVPNIESVEPFEVARKNTSLVYLNFKIQPDVKLKIRSKFIKSSLKKILSENYIETAENQGKTAIVEHTSANPISPLHVGNLRNSVHGDTIARILNLSGYEVFRHFYVNDVGLQVSFVILGYEKLKSLGKRPDIKPDVWFGRIYAIMHNLYYTYSLRIKNQNEFKAPGYFIDTIEANNFRQSRMAKIDEVKAELQILEKIEKPTKEEKSQIRKFRTEQKYLLNDISDFDKIINAREQLEARFPELIKSLVNEFKDMNLVEMTSEYLVSYENGSNKKIKALFREVCDWVLDTFFTTLKRFNIQFESVDYESDVVWSGLVDEVIEKLSNSKYVKKTDDSTLRLQYPHQAIKQMFKDLKIDQNRIPIKGNIPELQLKRKDGTALYAPKDIAYSITKFQTREPDLILNVISTEQTLPQFQLLLPLYELGYNKLAANMRHYAYELVELKGRIMSGRMARYVTADEYFDETIIRARMAKRASDLQRNILPPNNLDEFEQEVQMLSEVAIAATRFPLIETAPSKKIILDLDRELDFRRNTGPFVQYAHARTCSIFAKLEKSGNVTPNYNNLTDDLIIEIVQHLLEINSTLEKSIDTLDPSVFASWVYDLALKFMKFYENYPIISETDPKMQMGKIEMLKAIQKGLRVGLDTLGIPASEKL